jgi:hypothetical protein
VTDPRCGPPGEYDQVTRHRRRARNRIVRDPCTTRGELMSAESIDDELFGGHVV